MPSSRTSCPDPVGTTPPDPLSPATLTLLGFRARMSYAWTGDSALATFLEGAPAQDPGDLLGLSWLHLADTAATDTSPSLRAFRERVLEAAESALDGPDSHVSLRVLLQVYWEPDPRRIPDAVRRSVIAQD